jgi:branched-chain amino acid transport system ATP-binding protein
MLKIKNVNTYYGQVHAIKNVSLHLAEGEIVTLIGANGAGKTTLLNSLSGIVPPRSGEILFHDTDISRLPPHAIVRLGISQVPEGRQVFKPLSVEDNLELGAYLHHKTKEGGIQSKKDMEGSTTCSLSCGKDENSSRGLSPAANSKCWPLDAP